MDILLGLAILLAFCRGLVAAKLTETFEKFYTTDVSYTAPTGPHRHSAMGISTLAKFSMLSNTPTLFKVKRPGLNNDANSVSLESMQKPGLYLRYKNYKFHMQKNDETELFKKDATFHERLGPHGRAYELLGRDNWFMCHNDITPFTLKARSEKIGTKDFVNNCVYVPVKQDMVEKKNIVKTLPTGGAMVVNHVPTTQNTDKCISLRFVNHLGGPVRVVSSLKPEGYLVTANAFKLKTIFKHANHKQRHVIFYAENVQDRDDDVMLNDKNVFTVKPHECMEDFKNVVLSSQSLEQAAKSDAAISPNNVHTTPSNDLTKNIPSPPAASPPSLPAFNDGPAKPPAIPEITSKPQETTSNPPATNTTKNEPSISKDATLTTKNAAMQKSQKTNTNVPASEVKLLHSLRYHATPNPLPNLAPHPNIAPHLNPATNSNPVTNPNLVPNPNPAAVATPNPHPTYTANEVGVAAVPLSKINRASAWNPNQLTQTSYTAPLKQQIQNLDNVLNKRIQTPPVFGSVPSGSVPSGSVPSGSVPSGSVPSGSVPSEQQFGDGYAQWSSYSPCSVTCGVGTRRRTRVCRPGNYCFAPRAETRACIKEPCPSNCIHTIGGTVRSGSCCHFPFSYNGGHYYHCILSAKNNERMWCSTTPHFEQDKQWGYCPRSAKAPPRLFVKPVTPVMTYQQFPQPDIQSTLPSYNTEYYSNRNPYVPEEDTNIACNAMCSRVCATSCPRHCCGSVRADLPMTAYMGNTYDRNDKRSNVRVPYQPRH